MGGLDTGISAATRNICIESAVFDPESIRRTTQRLGLRSEASARFEKSLDPTFSAVALRRAVQFLEFARVGGTVTGSSEYVNESRVNSITLAITHAYIESRIGDSIDVSEVMKTLSDLEFAPAMCRGNFATLYPSNVSLGHRERNQAIETIYEVVVPSHRATNDMGSIDDIVEEVARIHGYDSISESPVPGAFAIARRNDWGMFRNEIQNYFSDSGFFEAYNYSFGNAEKDAAA
jgi:phenylalanyl-tRNA synthetase beta chain